MTMMIIVVHHQHGGTFLGLVRDPGITLLDSSYVSANFEFPGFTFGRIKSGFL
jgi:hypothetical protein